MKKKDTPDEEIVSLEEALEGQISLAAQVREDMRRLTEDSFREAVSPLVEKTELAIGGALKSIAPLKAEVERLPGTVKALLDAAVLEQVQGLNRAELGIGALSDRVSGLTEVRDRVKDIGDKVSALRDASARFQTVCGRTEADVTSLKGTLIPGVAKSIDALPGLLEATAAKAQKAAVAELKADVRVLTDRVEHLATSLESGLARQRQLAWAAIAACGLMLPLMLWVALRGI